MFGVIRIELSRVLKNKKFLFALAVGCIIALAHFFKYGYGVSGDIYSAKSDYPVTAFESWIGSTLISIKTFLCFLIAPILATIPFGDSFFGDKKSGHIKNVFIRTKKSHYYIAKYVATFIVGGLAAVVPLLLNFYLTTLVLPSLVPQVAGTGYLVDSLSMWYELFFSQPFVYVFLYLLIDFVFFGLIATLALSISHFVENRFVFLLAPFLLKVIMSFVLRSIGLFQYDPTIFLIPYQPAKGIDISYILVVAGILFALTFGTFYFKGVRDDAF